MIEGVKARFGHDLEVVRVEIGAWAHIHRFRYEHEYPMLLQLSEKLVELRDATISLRPGVGYAAEAGKEEEHKRQLLERFGLAMKDLYKFTEPRRPFLPADLITTVRHLDQIAWQESVQYRRRSPNPEHPAFDLKYWDRALENAAAIENHAGAALDRIRERVQQWEEFKPRASHRL